jgi:hypothetical protein
LLGQVEHRQQQEGLEFTEWNARVGHVLTK